ncbi:uncharacterized protein ALTATR162_LOCUS1165 [Alternaria atra]|uniref:DUF7730 domain-containing protein n=1 Tax=Alternaria atra TaxID=119953 RepID=A0A8J2MVT9_9PLEO|nr:uncharacterized protein ALTATR162_LOCUS1165 [Alternaria atra]CAG5142507.1 unnamed protein product [Alternaria atra]
MIDAPPKSPSRPVRLRNPSHSAVLPTPTASQAQTDEIQPDPSFSLLLSLPRELRDRVYVYALVSNIPFLWPATAPESYSNKPRNVNVNILRTNKQVYNEAVDILYSQNKFLFTHPSDCNIFRVVTSPASVNIQSVYFRIKDKDLGLWTAYLGSKREERSLRGDLPKLRNLWVFLRLAVCPHFISNVLTGPHGGLVGPIGGTQGGVGGGVQAVQNAMGQQIHALQQQVQNAVNQVFTNAQIVGGGGGHAHPAGNANQIPPPPPPAPAMPFPQFMQGALGLGAHTHHHQGPPVPHAHGQHNHPPNPSPLAQHLQQNQQANVPIHHIPAPANLATDPHRLYSSFVRSARFKVIESLCLQLNDVLNSRSSKSTPSTIPEMAPASSKSPPTTIESTSSPSNTEIKIVCILRPGKRQVERLLSMFPDELFLDPVTQDARTKFRKMHGVEVSVEFNGLTDVDPGMVRAGEVMIPWDGGWG